MVPVGLSVIRIYILKFQLLKRCSAVETCVNSNSIIHSLINKWFGEEIRFSICRFSSILGTLSKILYLYYSPYQTKQIMYRKKNKINMHPFVKLNCTLRSATPLVDNGYDFLFLLLRVLMASCVVCYVTFYFIAV